MFGSLKWAAKLNLAIGFVLKNVEDGSCRFYSAHVNTTLFERSKLVATTEDLTRIESILKNTDVNESCTREGTTKKWSFYKLSKVTIFATLLKEVPMGCKNTVLPHPLLKNHSVKCLPFEEIIRNPQKDSLCLYRALALHLQGTERLEEETSKLFNLFLKKTGGTDPANFRGVCMEDIAAVEDNVQADIFLYDIDIVDGSMIGELVRRSVGKHSNSVRLLCYNNHMCYVFKINAFFKAYRCPPSGQFIRTVQHLERLLTTCKERVKYVFPENVYQLRETLFDKIDSFNIPYSDDPKLFNNMARFDFESIFVQEDQLRDTDTTTWISKHCPISVWISCNLIEQPIFLCTSRTRSLVESFVDAQGVLGKQSKAQMKKIILERKTNVKSKPNQIFSRLNQRCCRKGTVLDFKDGCIEEEERDVSTQFLQTHKK